MSTVHDYESQAIAGIRISNFISESYKGVDIVSWYGRIERQLVDMLGEAEKGRNYPYADKVRQFLQVWRANEITGAINRETVEILKSATDMLAVDSWNLRSYFSGLRDQLRILIASEEELPRDTDMNQNDPLGGGGGGGGAPPMAPAFGPEEGAPPGAEGGKIPPPGTEGGAPGEEGGVAPGEAGAEEPGEPGQEPGAEDLEKDLEHL